MACKNTRCSCMDRFIRWLEDAEVYHAERRLKLSKFPNEPLGESHKAKAEAYRHALTLAHQIRCEHEPLKVITAAKPKSRWYQRIAQFFL